MINIMITLDQYRDVKEDGVKCRCTARVVADGWQAVVLIID